jgi:hypothetical protein
MPFAKGKRTFIIHTERGAGRLGESLFIKCCYIDIHVNHTSLVTPFILEMSTKLYTSIQIISLRISVDNNCPCM